MDARIAAVFVLSLVFACRPSSAPETAEPNLLLDPSGDWVMPTTGAAPPERSDYGSDYTDLVRAEIRFLTSDPAEPHDWLAARFELSGPPPLDGITLLDYGILLDFDEDGRAESRADLLYVPNAGWFPAFHRQEGAELALIPGPTESMKAVIQGSSVTLFISLATLGEADLPENRGFRWTPTTVEFFEYDTLMPPRAHYQNTVVRNPEGIGDVVESDSLSEGERPDEDEPPNLFDEESPLDDKRCAVVIGDDTKGIGPKDARDFRGALLQYPEWQPPRGVIALIQPRARARNVRGALDGLNGQGCTVLVFFYSGHGRNDSEKRPRDENHAGNVGRDERLNFYNVPPRQDVYDDELGLWLEQWQRANPIEIVEAGSPQGVRTFPSVLVILHACYSGGFVGGGLDLQARLLPPWEILMGSAESEPCRGRDPAPGQPLQNSFFVNNILAAMDVSGGDRRVTGQSVFEAADDETTDDVADHCTEAGACAQTPQRRSSPAGSTVTLHEPR